MRRVTDDRQPRRFGLPLTRGRRRVLTALAFALLGGAAFWGGAKAVSDGALDAVTASLVETGAQAGLRVEEIYVRGRSRTPPEHLLAALNVQRGDPILGIDLEVARQRVEALGWVASASIERRLPDEIVLTLTERNPIALWQIEGRFMMVDAEGREIPEDVELFTHLPLIVGDGAPAHAADLFAMLATEPDLAQRVKAAVRVGERRWNLRLDDILEGVDVHLPEEDPAGAWHRLAELERRQNLLSRDIVAVDLRLPDRLVLRAGSPDAHPTAIRNRKSAPGKEA
ncbi:cell division protein FtsQ/DivIB [Telmatospirillum sp. J64-1]|uniref:cell division protein FtsQ/DivIB n=1 Tax=Telmatospirillum sp. J64-1 TaxID=2502183 RepID=UPI00115C9E8F|nr:cell division protein FtsQ/DivIB [Telmatospirillum sp. J64-1]